MLQKELEIYPLIDILLEEEVLDVSDHDDVEDERTKKRQRLCLMTILGKVSWEKFGCVVWAFEQAELSWLLNELQKEAIPPQRQGRYSS